MFASPPSPLSTPLAPGAPRRPSRVINLERLPEAIIINLEALFDQEGTSYNLRPNRPPPGFFCESSVDHYTQEFDPAEDVDAPLNPLSEHIIPDLRKYTMPEGTEPDHRTTALCVVCRDVLLTSAMANLECKHSFCKACLMHMEVRACIRTHVHCVDHIISISCPVCRAITKRWHMASIFS